MFIVAAASKEIEKPRMFIHVDAELKPQTVPPVFPASYDEDARYLAAYRRNRLDAEYKAAVLVRT